MLCECVHCDRAARLTTVQTNLITCRYILRLDVSENLQILVSSRLNVQLLVDLFVVNVFVREHEGTNADFPGAELVIYFSFLPPDYF